MKIKIIFMSVALISILSCSSSGSGTPSGNEGGGTKGVYIDDSDYSIVCEDVTYCQTYKIPSEARNREIYAINSTSSTIKVKNNYNLESIEMVGNIDFENNGDITGWTDKGVKIENHRWKNAEFLNKGVIRNRGDYGIKAEGSQITIINENRINNSGRYGIYLNHTLTETVDIHNGTGSGDTIYKTGVIDNVGDYGIFIDVTSNRQAYEFKSYVTNWGSIKNNGNYGIYAKNRAVVRNLGDIRNTGNYGISMEDQTGDLMQLTNTATAIIANDGSYGVHLKGYVNFLNKGQISNGSGVSSGNYGVYALNKSTVTNEGRIVNKGDYGVYAEAFGVDKVVVQNSHAGNIGNSGLYGVAAVGNVEVQNFGVINNLNDYGVKISNGSTFNNDGLISNAGKIGIQVESFSTNTIARNNSTGRITNSGDYGAYAKGNGAKFINYGSIENTGDYGIVSDTSATVINMGKIYNKGNYGMLIDANAYSENNGEIILDGNNKTGVRVNNNSTFVSNGTIRLNGTNGTGIHATNGSTVKIGQNSKIILNGQPEINQSNTNYSNPNGNTNAGGTAYSLDATSILINAGTITTPTTFSVMGVGKFLLASDTGKIEAKTLNLEEDMYVDASATLNSAKDKYITNSLDVKDIIGTGSVKSDSVLFTAETTKNEDDTHSIILTRKNFKQLFSNELGEVLEKDYSNSDNSENSKTLYNSLKELSTTTSLGRVDDELTGNAIISNSLYNAQYLNNSIIKKMDKTLLDSDIYTQGIMLQTFSSNLEQDTITNSVGFDNETTSVLLSGMKPINDNLNLGLFFGYTKSEVEFDDDLFGFIDSNSEQNTDLWTIGGLMKNKLSNNLYLNSRIGVSFGDNDTERKITTLGNSVVKGNYDSFSIFGSTALEYRKDLNDFITIKPTVGLGIINTKLDGYTETGVTGYNLNVESTNATRVTLGTGLKADFKLIDNGDTKLNLSPYANYTYDVKEAKKDRTIRIDGLSSTLDVTGREMDRSALDLGLDLSFEYKSLTISGGYSNDILNDGNDHNFNIGVKLTF